MSQRELGRVEALARVKSKGLRLVDAAVLMRLGYRQTKRALATFTRATIAPPPWQRVPLARCGSCSLLPQQGQG